MAGRRPALRRVDLRRALASAGALADPRTRAPGRAVQHVAAVLDRRGADDATRRGCSIRRFFHPAHASARVLGRRPAARVSRDAVCSPPARRSCRSATSILLLGPWLSALATYLLVRDLLPGERRGPRASASFDNRRTTGSKAGTAECRGRSAGVLGRADRRDDLRPAAVPRRAPDAPRTAVVAMDAAGVLGAAPHGATGRIRDGVLTAVFVLAQFLSCIYYGMFLVLALALVGAAAAAGARARAAGRIARALLVGAIVCGPPLLAYAAPYRPTRQGLGSRRRHEIERVECDAGQLHLGSPRQPALRRTATYGGPEGRLWPGRRWRSSSAGRLWSARRTARAWMYGAMLVPSALLLPLGRHTPVYRLVARAWCRRSKACARRRGSAWWSALALAVLAGIGAAGVLDPAATGVAAARRGRVDGGVPGREYASDVGPLHPWLQRAPIYAALAPRRSRPASSSICQSRGRTRCPSTRPSGAFYGRTHQHPMANGYSGYYPRPYLDLLGAMIPFPRGNSLSGAPQPRRPLHRRARGPLRAGRLSRLRRSTAATPPGCGSRPDSGPGLSGDRHLLARSQPQRDRPTRRLTKASDLAGRRGRRRWRKGRTLHTLYVAMTRRDWLRRLAAAGAAGVVPGSELSSAWSMSMGGHAAWLREALPTLPTEPRRLKRLRPARQGGRRGRERERPAPR